MTNFSNDDIHIKDIKEASEEVDQRVYVDDSKNIDIQDEMNMRMSLSFWEFSFVPCIALILVLFVCYKKFFRYRAKFRNKRSNYKK